MKKAREKQRSGDEWRQLVLKQEASGETQTNFCRIFGINRRTFEKQRTKYKTKKGRNKFIEIEPKSEPRSWRYEIELPCGAILRGN